MKNKYILEFSDEFEHQFTKLNRAIQNIIWKKIQKMKESKKRRHLRFGKPYFVEEAGQYRIVYRLFEQESKIRLLFIGKHKDYEKWLRKET